MTFDVSYIVATIMKVESVKPTPSQIGKAVSASN